VVDALPRRKVAGQKSPGAAALEQVEDGIQDPAEAMYSWPSPSSLLRRGEVRLETGPFCIR
jgi:hypothetical protein